jgi:hypothetical protein
MTKAKDIVKKFEVSNIGNSKPPQWDGKKGDSYLMWKFKFSAHSTMLGLEDVSPQTLQVSFQQKRKTHLT